MEYLIVCCAIIFGLGILWIQYYKLILYFLIRKNAFTIPIEFLGPYYARHGNLYFITNYWGDVYRAYRITGKYGIEYEFYLEKHELSDCVKNIIEEQSKNKFYIKCLKILRR